MMHVLPKKKICCTHKCVKKMKKLWRRNKHLRKENQQLRLKNGNLVTELQNERMEKNMLFNDLHSLRTENMDHMIVTRGTLQLVSREISQIESQIGETVAGFIQASSALTKMQFSFGKVKTLIKDQNNQAAAPASSRPARLLNCKNSAQKLNVKNVLEDLEVIEEVSHENSISPMVTAKEPARYTRKCKKGLRNLICPRTSTSRRSSGKVSKRRSSYNEKDMSLEKSVLENVKNFSPSYNISKMDDVDNASGTESINETNCSRDSPSQLSEGSVFSVSTIETPRSSRAILKSAEKDNRKKLHSKLSPTDSPAASPTVSPANSSVSALDCPKTSDIHIPEASLSFINVKRGASKRRINVSEATVRVKNSLASNRVSAASVSPNLDRFKPVLNSGGAGITHRKRNPAHHTTSSFTFYSLEPDWPRKSLGSQTISVNNSTLKAVQLPENDKENDETLITKSKKKRGVGRRARGSIENSPNKICSKLKEQRSPLKGNPIRASEVYNSTPVDLEKPSKRQPLRSYSGNTPNLVSSTQITANESHLLKRRQNFNVTESMSPIMQDCSGTLSASRNDGLQSSFMENSSNNDSTESKRPRRKATGTANYKEPSINKKLRRKS